MNGLESPGFSRGEDVKTCSYDVGDKAASTIARQIADRVVGQ